MPIAEDGDLIQKLAAGDEESLEILHKKYFGLVLSIIYGLCKNRAIAEELTQETFLIVYQKASSCASEREGSVWQWIRRIAVNLTNNFRRKIENKNIPVSIDEYGEGVLFNHSCQEGQNQSSSGVLESKEFILAFYEALDWLTDKQKLSMVLREIKDLSYEEIAGVMNISVSDVKITLWRARKKLAHYLKDYQ